MSSTTDLAPILAEYPRLFRPNRIEPMGAAGGFSGATFWRLQTSRGPLCLRRWPRERPTVEELEFIHAVLRHVVVGGFLPVPAPLETERHTTYVRYAGCLWELTPWMPGEADFHQSPSPVRLQAALTALAQFHRAAEGIAVVGARSGPSPGIRSRSERLQRWLCGDLERLRQAIQPGIWPELEEPAHRICRLVPLAAPAVADRLTRALPLSTPLQACIGDIWHDHVLFRGDHVTGLIDFGSMRIESVAADVARLLGSMAGDDRLAWQAGLEAYQAVRPFSQVERRLVEAFDQSLVLMAGLNWVEWIYKERRIFEAAEAIPARIDSLTRRLEHLRQEVADVR